MKNLSIPDGSEPKHCEIPLSFSNRRDRIQKSQDAWWNVLETSVNINLKYSWYHLAWFHRDQPSAHAISTSDINWCSAHCVIKHIISSAKPQFDVAKVDFVTLGGLPEQHWYFMKQFKNFISSKKLDPEQMLFNFILCCRGRPAEGTCGRSVLEIAQGYARMKKLLRLVWTAFQSR